MAFPKWLTRREDGVFVIDTDIAYPLALAAIRAAHKDDGPVDQFRLEVAFQCTKMVVQDIVDGSPEDPRIEGNPLRLMTACKDKEKWALRNYPEGLGVVAATQERAARAFKRPIKAKLLAA